MAALKLPNMAQVRKGAMSVDTFNDKWDVLSKAFDLIHSCEHANCSFQQLFTAAYQLGQQGYSAQLYERVVAKIADHVALERDAILAAIRDGGPEAVLGPLIQQWERHCITCRRITDLSMQLERQYCARERKPLIIPLGVRTFGTVVLGNDDIVAAMQRTFLGAVAHDRNGDAAAPTMRLRAVSRMLLEVDAASHIPAAIPPSPASSSSSSAALPTSAALTSSPPSCTSLFRTRLEIPFLDATDAFYTNEARTLLCRVPVPEYVAQYFRRLGEETSRAAACLDDTTIHRVEAIVTQAFIAEHAAALVNHETSGASALLSAWRVDDLRNLYSAFSKTRDSTLLVSATAEYFLAEGMATVTNEDNMGSPIVFVEKLIDLYGRIRTLLREAYTTGPSGRMDHAVERQLLSVFSKVVNRQPFTAEYLSRLLDNKLRSNLPDADVERAADDVMTVFQHLTEKDLFELAYKNHLARRLLAGRATASEDQERIFIGKLKKECGVTVASSLEGMFADRAQSDDLAKKFAERLAERGETLPLSLSCFVLTAGFWPPPVQLKMDVPAEMDRAGRIFRMFYLGRHQGRRFDYSFANGSVDVRLNFGGRRYEINVPTMCAPVVMHFQGDEAASVEELSRIAGLEVADTAKAVASLVRSTPTNTGVLALEGGAGGGISGATRVVFNVKFKSKNLKLRVAIAVAKDRHGAGAGADGPGGAKGRSQIDEDRSHKVDAAIVRIMKSRKVLEHHVLVAEVVGVLSKVFAPSPDLIKRRIEHLIEREFLERSAESRNVYSYLA